MRNSRICFLLFRYFPIRNQRDIIGMYKLSETQWKIYNTRSTPLCCRWERLRRRCIILSCGYLGVICWKPKLLGVERLRWIRVTKVCRYFWWIWIERGRTHSDIEWFRQGFFARLRICKNVGNGRAERELVLLICKRQGPRPVVHVVYNRRSPHAQRNVWRRSARCWNRLPRIWANLEKIM